MKTQKIIDFEVEIITGSGKQHNTNNKKPRDEKPKEKQPKDISNIEAELIELKRISELEKKIVEEKQEEKKHVEDLAEESFSYKENSYNIYLTQQEAVHEAEKPINESFQKTDKYASEVRPWWYIKHRTVAQNLRNITLTRGLMGELEYSGNIVVKKVK